MTAEPIIDAIAGSADALRHVMGHFVSSVTLITAVSDERLHAMTATAVSSVSLEPPLILFCVAKISRFHDAVLRAGAWAVSILTAEQEPLAHHFSHRGRPLATQFDNVTYFSAPRSGAPVLSGCLAWLDCRTHGTYDGGDHTIVVGELLAASRSAAFAAPLAYYRGSYNVGPRTT
jgi:flavin reductase